MRVTFLGDVLVGGEAQPTLDRRGDDHAFAGIRHLLAGSDLVVANHEGPITARDVPDRKLDTGRKRYWYRALPRAVDALVDAGVRVVSLGNNHVLDFGADALADTIRALDEAGIASCGAGMTRAEARRPAIITVNGVRFGFLSFMQRYHLYVEERLYATRTSAGPLRLTLSRAQRDLERLAERADVRVALVHWGRNYRKRNQRQTRLANALCNAGADLVIGHHPHVPQPIELRGGVPVCYSLGNGPLGTPGRFHSGRPPYGLVTTFDVDAHGHISRIAVQTILVDNAQVEFSPRVDTSPESRRLLRRLLPDDMTWREDDVYGFVCDAVARTGQPVAASASIADANLSSQAPRVAGSSAS